MEKELLDFMKETSRCLGKIEGLQEGMFLDIKEIKSDCKKIPPMELGLNNHLTGHNNVKKYVLWPILVGVTLTIAASIGHYFFKLFT